MRQNKNTHSPPGQATSRRQGLRDPCPGPPRPARGGASGAPESSGPSSGSLLGSSTHQELEHSVGKVGANNGCSSESRRDLPPPARWAAPAANFRFTPRYAPPALLHPEAVPGAPPSPPPSGCTWGLPPELRGGERALWPGRRESQGPSQAGGSEHSDSRTQSSNTASINLGRGPVVCMITGIPKTSL